MKERAEIPGRGDPPPNGGTRPIIWTASLERRFLLYYAETGSRDIAAGKCFLHRKSFENRAEESPKFARRMLHAKAAFLYKKAVDLPKEENAVRAQSLRFILARLCPDYREEKTPIVVQNGAPAKGRVIRFERGAPPAPK